MSSGSAPKEPTATGFGFAAGGVGTASRRSATKAWAAFGLFVAVSLLTRGIALAIPIVDLDEASYIVGSWELMRGGLLYSDFADHKPPLVYAYYALAQAALGRGMLAVRLLTTLVVVPLTALAVSAFFRHGRPGIVAGLIYLVYGAAFIGHDVLAVNCELLLLLPASWAIVLLREAEDALRPLRLAAAGVLLGMAVLFKYQAAFWLPAAALATIVAATERRAAGRLPLLFAALLAGFAAPLLATLGLFAALGGAEGFLYWNVVHGVQYARNPILASEALGRAASYLVPFLLTTAWLWWGWRRSIPLSPSRYQAALVSALVACSLAAACIGLRFFPHYFVQLYVPLAFASAPWAAAVLRRPMGLVGRLAMGWSLAVLLGFTVANAWLYLVPNRVYEETRPVFENVAHRLRADPCFRGANLFVWGYAPMFYYWAELPAASRFVLPESTLVGYVPGNDATASGLVPTRHLVRERDWEWLMQDLERKRPTYVIDTAPSGLHRWGSYPLRDFPRLLDLLGRAYERLGTVDGVDLYRRRGCGGPP